MTARRMMAAGTVTLLLVLAATWVSGSAEDKSEGAEKKTDKQPENGREDLPLRDYMRKKLAASNQILEGLCTEDFELVVQGSRTLNEMSTSERWRVNNDPMYRQFSGDFREISQLLVEAAEKKNLDRVALKWMDATMSCVECHRFVRGIRLAERPQN